jgi:hypothetical protein
MMRAGRPMVQSVPCDSNNFSSRNPATWSGVSCARPLQVPNAQRALASRLTDVPDVVSTPSCSFCAALICSVE